MIVKNILLTAMILTASILSAAAQDHQLKGIVLDKENGEPLPGVQVFLNQTTIGTATNDLGSFTLRSIPSGLQNIVFKMIGYETFVVDIEFPNDDMARIEVEMEPKVFEMDEVNVKDRRPRDWLRDLEEFKKYLFGFTENSKYVSLINPEVLDFERTGGVFLATARKPLKIRNDAIGYKITYFLEQFRLEDGIIRSFGFTRFEELKPEDDNQLEEWKRNRRETYEGSFRHFISHLMKGTLQENGYRLYYTNRKLQFFSNRFDEGITQKIRNATQIFRPTRNIREIALFNRSGLPYIRVEYVRERPDAGIVERYGLSSQINAQISWIEFPNDKAVIDPRSGNEMAPYRALLHGYWGWSSRIPDLLPQEFD